MSVARGLGDGGAQGRARAEALRFFAWTLALSVPFWVLGVAVGTRPEFLPHVPWAALGALVPAAVALGLWSRGTGVDWRHLLAAPGRWWLLAVLAGAGPVLIEAARGGTWPPPPLHTLVAYSAIVLVGAFGEEIGWMGYAWPRSERWVGAPFRAAVLLGCFWVLWHGVPYLQTGRPL